MNEFLEWLKKRAEEEQLSIANKKIGWLSYQFTSKEKIAENEKEAAKSLGKIEMILEIFQEYNRREMLKQNES